MANKRVRPTLRDGFSAKGWTEEYGGRLAVGPVLIKAGAAEEDFNILGDPTAAAKVVALLKQLNAEDVEPESNGQGAEAQLPA